jgi:hypothetical protein
MKRLALAAALLIASLAAALAQGTVTRVGPITPGDCASFSSPNTIQDGGFPCTGAAGGPAGGVLSGTYPNPAFSAAVQSALTGTNNQLLIGTGGFGFAAIVLGGDCTFTSPNIICTKTNGTLFGTFATANAATPPAIGGTTPAAGAFSSLTDTGIAGSTQCVQANSSGLFSGSGGPCGASLLGSNNTWTGDNLFQDGRPWCDIRSKGALQDGSTDDTAAIQACVTVVSAFGTGGTVYFPPSGNPSCIKTAGGVTHTSGGAVRFIGSSEGGGMSACQTDTTILTINVPLDDVEFLNILGKGVNNDTGTFGANHPTLSLGSLCVQCRIANNLIQGGSNAISVQTSDAYFENNSAGYALGGALVYLGSSGPVVGNWFVRNKFDQLWPQGYQANCQGTAWAASTVYALGACVTNQGFVLQATQGGTSAGSQPTLKNYGITITDNTVHWQIAAPQTYYSVQVDTNAAENQLLMVDHTGPFSAGIAMTNSLAGTAPTHLTIGWGVIGQTVSQSIILNAGSDINIIGERIGGPSLTAGDAICTCNAAWTGELTISDSTIVNAGAHGINLGFGVNNVITNNRIYGATTACISINVLQTNISNNVTGSSSGPGTCTIGIQTVAPANFYNIVYNIVHGATTGVSDGAAGANKNVIGNL